MRQIFIRPVCILVSFLIAFEPTAAFPKNLHENRFGFSQDGTLQIIVMKQPIRNILNEVAREAGLRVSLTNEVRGSVKHMHISGTFEDVMENLAKENHFEWFIYIDTLFISMQDAQETHVFKLEKHDAEGVLALLHSEIPSLNRFNLRAVKSTNSISLTGPVELIEIINTIASSISNKQEPRHEPKTVKVRRGTEEAIVIVE
ncbi:MAG: hypothetical protein AAGF53_02505 [Pseudomonadota bacterium]